MEDPLIAQTRIFMVRGQRVMLDSDLAAIYGTTTKKLNQAVRRNPERFPVDFCFRLTLSETQALVPDRSLHGGRRYVPLAFTEHGAVMLSAILKTDFAVRASIVVARAFVRFRGFVAGNRTLTRKLRELEQRVEGHDREILRILDQIRELLEPPLVTPKRIGFEKDD